MRIKGNLRYQLLPLVLIPLGLMLYNDALRAPFVYDDKGYIVQNEAIRSLSGIDPLGTRYLGFLSFALNYAAGGLTAFDFHLVNVLIHIANAVLVFFLVTAISDTPLLSERSGDGPRKETVVAVAAAASLIFLSHPIQTQAVTYVTQRFTSLATMFYLLAVLLYASSRAAALRSDGGGLSGKCAYAFSLVFTLMAMKTKEISFTIPFAILIYDWLFFRDYKTQGAARRIPFYFLLLVIPLSLVLPEYYAADTGSVTDTLRKLQVQEAAGLPRDVYTFTQFQVIVSYLKLLVFPVGLAIDHGYPLSVSFFEPATLASFLFLSVLLASAVFIAISRKRPGVYAVLFAFGILWFFNGLIVESFLVPIQDVMFEQRTYLPGIGFFIAATSVVLYMFELAGRRLGLNLSSWAAAVLVMVLAVPALSAATLSRNEVWTDEMKLLDEAIGISPGKARLHYARASLRLDRKDYEGAVLDASVALRLNPAHAGAAHARAEALQGLGRTDEALKDFSRAIALDPGNGTRYYNRAVALDAKGDFTGSIADYTKAVNMGPDNPAAYNNRGIAYSRLGEMGRALEDIKIACAKGYAAGCSNLERLKKAGTALQ